MNNSERNVHISLTYFILLCVVCQATLTVMFVAIKNLWYLQNNWNFIFLKDTNYYLQVIHQNINFKNVKLLLWLQKCNYKNSKMSSI